MARLQSRKAIVETSLSELVTQAKELQRAIEPEDNKIGKVKADIESTDAKEAKAMQAMGPLDAKLAKVEAALAKAEAKTVKLLKAMDEADKKLELSSDAVAQSEAAFAKASADVEKVQTSQGALLVKLVELIQQEQHTLQLKLLE